MLRRLFFRRSSLASGRWLATVRAMVAFAPLKNSRSRTISRRPTAHVGAGVPATINTHRHLSPPRYDVHRGDCYVDEPLMMKAGGQNYYYATNRLYSVAAISDQSGAVVERYKYDAYGKQGILAPNGVIAYKPSDYGQFVGFTGRTHDWETGLAYFRARYFDNTLGRFIGPDPAGYVDGMGLYNGYFVPNKVDPSGLLLVAIDGTGSEEYLNGADGKEGTADDQRTSKLNRWKSHVRNFYLDYRGAPKGYWHGPKNVATGSDSSGIHNGILDWICKQLSLNPKQPIDIVGHSRGGYIAMEVARTLKTKGCSAGCPLKVRFLGLYDPVDMTLGYGEAETVSDNVQNAAIILADRNLGSRGSWNRADHGAEDLSKTNYQVDTIWGTHSGIGGAPWDGDHPDGTNEGLDKGSSIISDRFIRQRAIAVGVPINEVKDYDFGK